MFRDSGSPPQKKSGVTRRQEKKKDEKKLQKCLKCSSTAHTWRCTVEEDRDRSAHLNLYTKFFFLLLQL